MHPASLFLLPLSSLLLPALAQEDDYALTVIFSSGNSSTCQVQSATDSLTFSTASIPTYSQCFNINELFTGHNSSTFSFDAPDDVQNEISYALHGAQAFDALANYSHVLVDQNNIKGKPKVGKRGTWDLNVFPGLDCQEVEGQDYIETWYGWSCQTGEGGQCNTLPYNAKSFLVAAASAKGHCYDFATEGKGATSIMMSGKLLMGAVGVAIAVGHLL
ncbi:hypothetical protein LTR36_000274 [Oleoguttula mirabilis]|uniref:Uncharacterized protein n=1 Tax=Oleoguttula mirabilis TaxID=1507867 RepID=A0AAV9JZ94_9PEZI|nr:hypothetical protein LTR36_000274 [Oleoguttula mirabilis]